MKRTLNFFPLLAIVFMFSFTACNSDEEEMTPTTETPSTTDCTNSTSTFTINLDPGECTVDIENTLGISSQYTETLSGSTREIQINSVPNHQVGVFPNPGNPNTISSQSFGFSMPINPTVESNSLTTQGYISGVLFSGVTTEPYTAEFFRTSTGGMNREWNITTLTSAVNLGLDCNNAHVQPTGKYHYHGTPSALIDELGVNGDEMVKVGYAADGFPFYYKYVLDEDGSSLIELESGYRLIEGSRPGDGDSAPSGCYDGTYFQDYEFVEGISLLDACNGRFGPTPDAPSGEYYYVITDNFPSVPLCFTGTPDQSFRLGPN
ncbi:MAG: YHYH protein [Bacteroidota bacterium]